MPRYRTVIGSTWSVERAFAYLCDFSHAAEWDPGVVAGTRRDGGEIRTGSEFDLTVAFAGRTIDLRYRVVDISAPHRVSFAASTKWLTSVDTLTLESHGGGCELTYDAVLRFKGAGAIANPLLSIGFGRVGNRARDSLRAVLATA